MPQVPSNLIPSTVTQLPFAPEASAQGLLLYTLNGVSYKIYAGDLLQVAGVPTTRQVIAGTGLQGGGQLSSNVTLSVAPGGIGTTQLASTGVTPGTYGSGTQVPVLTVDNTGRVTAATTTAVTITGFVPESRQVIAGPGLTGGGALNNNVTLSADLSSGTPLALSGTGSAGTATAISRSDHRHPAVNLGDQTQIDGILPLDQGGTARSIVPDAGAIVWSGADGLYLGPVGGLGQVLVSGGAGEYVWGSAVTLAPMPANHVFAGPAAGPNALSTFRLLVNADIPGTLTSKNISLAIITNSSVDSTPIGANSASTGAFTTVGATTGNITTVNATTVDTTNVEATNLKAKDGAAAGSIADVTGVVTLNSAVLTTADINGGTADGVTIGGSVPAAGTFTTANATDVNATTVDTTNLEVTNLKAKDGTAAATIADSTGAVTVSTLLNVDNLRLDGNTLSSTDTNGNINLDPNGTGEVAIPAGVDGPLYIEFNTTQSPLPADATGRIYYDNNEQFQTLSFQMNGSVVQHIGEEVFFRVKCQGAIAKGQVVMFAGTLGSSGGLIGAVATGLTPLQANYILGVADESGNNNEWIFVTQFGEVRNINTTGGAEAWTQGQELYYNPAVAGGLTKTKPSAPNAIATVAAVVHVGTSNGILFVRPTFGSVLGGTDGNVQFGTLNNGDVIIYDSVDQRWENFAQSALSVGTATNAVNTEITDDTTTNATMYPTWVTANTGNLPQKVTSTKLTFNPSTGVLTAAGGIGGGVF